MKTNNQQLYNGVAVKVGLETESLVKVMLHSSMFYDELMVALTAFYGKDVAFDKFSELFSDAFAQISDGLQKCIGESVFNSISVIDNRREAEIII